MIVLPVTCKQLGMISLCVMFAGGVYMMHISYDDHNIPVFTTGVFVAGFPVVIGLVCFIWYSYVFLDKHVRCKCE